MNRIGPAFEVEVLKYFQFLGKAGLQNFEKKEEFELVLEKLKNSSRPKPRRGFFDYSDEPPTHTRLQ